MNRDLVPINQNRENGAQVELERKEAELEEVMRHISRLKLRADKILKSNVLSN